jgi:hypothetical protein
VRKISATARVAAIKVGLPALRAAIRADSRVAVVAADRTLSLGGVRSTAGFRYSWSIFSTSSHGM